MRMRVGVPGHAENQRPKGHAKRELSKEEFATRFRDRFYDPPSPDRAPSSAKSSRSPGTLTSSTAKARARDAPGPGFADPDLRAAGRMARDPQQRSQAAEAPAEDAEVAVAHPADQRLVAQRPDLPRRDVEDIPPREHRAGESSRRSRGFEVDLLDLSRLTSEYGRVIYPCKACVSTAMPLCHWPCSCYPNHALGQANDWMAEIYPRWVAAHGVMIVCPVNWYQAPSALKLMIDRLVCADGGNPDPTSTGGKDPAAREGAGAHRLALSTPPRRPRVLGRRPRRRRRRRKPAPHR